MKAPKIRFHVGDEVKKHTGDYTIGGTVVASFAIPAGRRYVVAHPADTGVILHIYGGGNLQHVGNQEQSIQNAEQESVYGKLARSIFRASCVLQKYRSLNTAPAAVSIALKLEQTLERACVAIEEGNALAALELLEELSLFVEYGGA